MNDRPLQLWLAYPGDVLPDEVVSQCADLLSEDERSRLQCFRSEKSAREYLVAHALVRSALSWFHPLAPEAWRFRTTSHGKPEIEPDCGLRFNLSHSAGLAVCLISSQAEVGVDVEHCERGFQILEVADDVFSPIELAQLGDLRTEDKLGRALLLWTLKEAYLKAIGVGLSLPLKKISIVFDDVDGIRLEHDTSSACVGRWRFCFLDYAEHRIALITERTGNVSVQLWETRPALAIPRQLAELEQTWYPIVRASR
jgi:4'-phosphopantetheinyl transferase